ncbi:MAG: hypothetical protein AB203_02090 [Parcubacteria bacterium C7867-008]|nr:MAG: hypothetical protein AB203_02090 [Parcubacteria bacterium C7867-008]
MTSLRVFTRGFTLIELLVVIAIIGILSSVVLASLNTARNKGVDAAVKTNLGEARGQAELFYDANNFHYVGTAGTVDDVCFSGASVGGVRGIYGSVSFAGTSSGGSPTVAMTGSPSSPTEAACHADMTAWAASAPLRHQVNMYYCVDSTGIATVTPNVLPAGQLYCS